MASAEKNRGDHEVQGVDETSAQEVPRSAVSTADAHIQPTGGLSRLREHFLYRRVAEVEGRSPFHGNRRTGCRLREHVYRRAIWRVRAPPALPVLVVGERV